MTEEACELFVEWIEEWKTAKNWKKQICGRAWWFKCPFFLINRSF
jgi:hypothetical protein